MSKQVKYVEQSFAHSHHLIDKCKLSFTIVMDVHKVK